MAHRRSIDRHSRPLLLIFDSASTIINSITIKNSLPALWRHDGSHILRDNGLSLDAYCSHRGRIAPKAIRILGQYLCEVDEGSPVSAALSNGLEDIWRNQLHHGYDSADVAVLIFHCLATMFDGKYFGCNEKMFKQMELFFHRHCGELLYRSLEDWILVVKGLDRMSLNFKPKPIMTNVLASVLQECNHKGQGPRTLINSMHLAKNSRRILSTLIEHEYQRLRRSHRHGPHRLRRRGDEVPPEDRMYIAMNEPHRITINGNGPISSDPYYDDDGFFGEGFAHSDGMPFIDRHLLDNSHRGLGQIPMRAMLGRP